jgi:hypothetical protein
MESLVQQLQREALDSKIPITDLLRKALVVSIKLKAKEMQVWIESEIAGYGAGRDIPEYRKIQGQVKAFNPVRGWIPVTSEDPAETMALSQDYIMQPISEIQHLLSSFTKGTLRMPLHPELERALQRAGGRDFQMCLQIQPSSLVRLTDAVRDIVLKWSLKLQEDGVSGEGMTFSKNEIQTVAGHTYNIIINGNVSNSQIQQASHSSTQQAEKS